MPNEASQIGPIVKAARTRAGLSQVEAARRLGIDSVTLSRYERGVLKVPRTTLIALAGLYSVEPTLFGLQADSLGDVPRATPRTVPEMPVARQERSIEYTAHPRHARNLPLAVREYLAEFQLRLVKGGASEDEIDEAMALLRSPDVFSYFKGGKLAEYNEQDVLDGMRSLAEDVVIPRLQKLGRKVK
jgi:transcriptional regulator with XRE-family HTH domain